MYGILDRAVCLIFLPVLHGDPEMTKERCWGMESVLFKQVELEWDSEFDVQGSQCLK